MFTRVKITFASNESQNPLIKTCMYFKICKSKMVFKGAGHKGGGVPSIRSFLYDEYFSQHRNLQFDKTPPNCDLLL